MNRVSRVIALDPGTKRIGVAASNTSRTMAFPRDAIAAGDGAISAIADLIASEGVTLVVIGRPVSLAGTDTASSAMADRFVADLASSVEGVEFVTFDERLTTVDARRRLASAGKSDRAQRSLIDSEAATVLLQSFLDATNS